MLLLCIFRLYVILALKLLLKNGDFLIRLNAFIELYWECILECNAVVFLLQMLTGMDTEDFLSSLLEEEEDMGTVCPSRSPSGSDSGISDDSRSTGVGNNNIPGCPSPQSSDTDVVPSPSYSEPSPVHSDPALGLEEVQTESLEALTVKADHSYSLLQSGGRDMDILESVRAEKPDTDVFIDLGMFSSWILWVLWT